MEKNLVAYCGLYCGACPRYKKGKCTGCRENEKLGWCGIRTCNREKGFHNCAECPETAFRACSLVHNGMSRFFAMVFNSDRDACVARIREVGAEAFAGEREAAGLHTIRRK